ncbi:hypothetical protein ACFU5O_02740 [Streptomyces sp. NPDC057445]|uniref:hypothetical protein n=1 Tax=Streptomyces sp. NPDC057445 TaxID=3346136 RepID=UPI0036A5EA55
MFLPLLAVGGSDDFRAALDFTSGVLSLLSLTASVAWGLLATDRLLLSIRHRLLAQAIHRTTAVASLGFLLLHGTVKVSLGHVELIGAFIPFSLGVTGTSGLIGLGSLAGMLMVVAASTGAARSALAGNSRMAGRWRALHMLAYPAWCAALMHGLYTGRPAATWVTTMYCLALAGVAGAVSLRLLPRQTQRRLAERVMALMGSGGQAAEVPEQTRRNMSDAPLPGAPGGTSGAEYERDFPRRRPEDLDEPLGRPIGQPLGSPLGAPLGQPLAPPRGEPRRIAAPAPPLYEAAPPPVAEPATATGSFLGAGPVTGGPLPGDGPGTGISAAYRAVSLAGDTTARPTGTGASAPSGDVPLAERIPMTEELPVIDESAPRPSLWPAPSPPPPAQAFPPPPASSRYETGTADPLSTGATPSYDTGSIPAYDTGAMPSYNTGAMPAYDTGAMPTYETGSTPLYETGANPLYETGATPVYTDPYDPATGGYGSASAYSSGTAGAGYDNPSPTSPLSSVDDTRQSPGPLYPPQAGEPWHAPAGERP